MATTTVAYGSISIVDITDIGELSVYPKSNLPLSVIYNPDQNSFTPNWGTSNLALTPSIWYGGEALSPTATGVTVSWTRQEGASSPTALTTGETVSNGILNVTANKFTENSTMLTYIVTISYIEPTSQQTLTAEGQITFSLVKQASTVKSATITGDSIFKYNTSGSITGATSITLTGRVTNGSISAWQYQLANGNWATYPNSTTGTTLTVTHTDNVFNNDKCVIRLLHSDNTVYDLHTITKLRDGAAGTDTISAVLTNEDQMIPFNSQGQGDFSAAVSQLIIYESGSDVTSQWSITQDPDSNLTTTPSTTTKANDTVTVTGMTGSSGNVTFTAQKSGHADIIKQFSVVKVESGVDGVSPTIYSLEPDTLAMNKTIGTTPTFTPATVTFYAYQMVYNTSTQVYEKSAYHGRFKIYENIAANDITSSTTAAYSSSNDESTGKHQYTPSNSCNSIVCVLYASGGFTTKLDTQTVAITSDGQTGQQGEQGEDGEAALNVIVGNSYDGIPVTSENVTSTAYTVTIPFAGYQGTSKVATTVEATIPTLLGITPTVVNATTSADGSITYVIPSGTAVNTDGGTLTFRFKFTEANKIVTYDYSWGKNRQARDGVNSILLQLATPDGNVFENGEGTLDIVATIYDGTTDVSAQSGTSYQWAKFSNGSYADISGATSRTLTVSGSTVDGYASYRCAVGYGGNTYYQYMSLIDKTDPLQVTILSSVGDKLVNGNGVGALYAKVYRKGEEVDPIKSERFVVGTGNLPTTGVKSGDYCYVLDTTNKTVQLYKYTSSWGTSSESYTGTYNWYYRDKDGNVITSGTPSAGGAGAKVIYIDGDLVNKKLIVDVKVTI